MKKILCLLISLCFIPFIYAKEPTWSDIDLSCFARYTKIDNPKIGSNKVKIISSTNIFLVQDQKILPNKVLFNQESNFVEYQILKITALASGSQTKFLSDGNLNTSIDFDPYNPEPKEINLDAKQMLLANTFDFKLNYSGNLKPIYFVSKDNNQFIEVSDVKKYDWQYLKIQFRLINNNSTIAGNASVQEIGIFTLGKPVYLFNTYSKNTVELYTDYQCDSDAIHQLWQQMSKLSHNAQYSIDINTVEIDLDWQENPVYKTDFDNDGIKNELDNCPFLANSDQADIDGDLVGNACDFDNTNKNSDEQDNDRDGIGNGLDNCPDTYNPMQTDTNADNVGDLCADDDQDGIIGYQDNCVNVKNADQIDVNINGVGDACEFDKDKDGIFDSVDNCIVLANADQKDSDNDGIGDLCDNCEEYNPTQLDKDQNNMGDVCDNKLKNLQANDQDQDGIINFDDNCSKIANADQKDTDNDDAGDVCDNCLNLKNTDQKDANKNNVGDFCEDVDSDGIDGYLDNCADYANADQKDTDNDGIGDVCEDDDLDNLVNAKDNCPFDYNPDQWDADKDGVGDECDKQDNRFIESNKWVIIGGMVVLTLIFAMMITIMLKKLSKK